MNKYPIIFLFQFTFFISGCSVVGLVVGNIHYENQYEEIVKDSLHANDYLRLTAKDNEIYYGNYLKVEFTSRIENSDENSINSHIAASYNLEVPDSYVFLSRKTDTLFFDKSDIKLIEKNNMDKNAVLVFAGFGLILDIAAIYGLSQISIAVD
jgi:hypothetical protein